MILCDFTKNGLNEYIVYSKRLKAYDLFGTIGGALSALHALMDTKTRHSQGIACANTEFRVL